MNEQVRALFEEDRRDSQTFRDDEAFVASQARRGRLEDLLAGKKLHDADDFYHAAYILQHGERLEHWAQAHLLARTAAELGHPKGRYQAAAALDRWLMHMGLPQKFGTCSVVDGDGWRLWDIDPQTSDEEREGWGVPALEQLLTRAYEAFGQARRSERFAEPLLRVEVSGVKIGLYEVGIPPLDGDGVLTDVPSYTPLERHDPRPKHLPPNVTLWRLGRLFCAKDSRSRVVCSWHPCRWAVLEPEGVDPEDVFERLERQPQALSATNVYWTRVAVAANPAHCWIVGGVLGQPALAKLALSLVN